MNPVSRRDFIKGAGGIVVGFSLVEAEILPQLFAQSFLKTAPTPPPDQLDSWLRIGKDGIVHVFTGKHEVGTGNLTGFQQIVAEELDVPFEKVIFTMGDTAMTPDQGGITGSDSIQAGAPALRNASASARFLLVERASKKLGVPSDQLQVKNGVVSVKGDESRSITYGALVDGMELNEVLKVTPLRLAVDVHGSGKPKDPSTYTIVGKPIPRVDLPPKILGQFTFVADVRVPGMLHGRIIRPAAAGATVMGIDESAAKQIPGFVKTIAEGSFVGVVTETEWSSIRASRAIKVTWSDPGKVFPEDIYAHMRSVTPKSTEIAPPKGDAAAALAGSVKKLEVTYEWPFQAHATMGSGCAVADVHPDGVTTIWSGAFKPHRLKKGLAQLLHVPEDQVRVISVEDAGGYGRCGYEDVAADATLLSKAIGRPVRVQWMRSDMTAWGGKPPAAIAEAVAGFSATGEITAIQFTSRAFSCNEFNRLPDSAGNLLAGQLTGVENTTGFDTFIQWVPPYQFPFPSSSVAHILHPLHTPASPLRTMHMRLPGNISGEFAGELFVDELAAAVGADPVDFRLQHLTDERSKAVLSAATERAGWDRRPSPKPAQSGEIVTGRGVAQAHGGTRVATVAEVEVNRGTGAVRVKRLVCACDCGLIINPDCVRGIVEGNLIQSMSRSMKEEVTFDQNKVTSVDWNSYKIVRMSDVPEEVDVILLNHPESPSTGAGEPPTGPTAPAIASAIFDAIGVRVRRVPFTPARIKEAIASQGAV